MDTIKVLSQLLEVSQEKIILALQERDHYKLRQKKKKTGGYRLICAPPENLKFIQHLILDKLFYQINQNKYWAKKQYIDYRISGLRYGGICYNGNLHIHKMYRFAYQLDLKDAFPSIRSIDFVPALRHFLLTELETYQAYVDELTAKENVKIVLPAGIGYSRRKHSRTSYKDRDYGKFTREKIARTKRYQCPWFFNEKTDWFRTRLVHENESVRTKMFEIAIDLVELIGNLCSLPTGNLPQGAPTSPFLLALTQSYLGLCNISKEFGKRNTLSIYVDDICVTSEKRLSKDDINEVIKKIEKKSCFKINRKKIRFFDRHKVDPLICGIRLGKAVIKSEEDIGKFSSFHWSFSCYEKKTKEELLKKIEKGKPEMKSFITVPKKVRKKFRALQFKLKNDPNNQELRDAYNGYRGILIDVDRRVKTNMNYLSR